MWFYGLRKIILAHCSRPLYIKQGVKLPACRVRKVHNMQLVAKVQQSTYLHMYFVFHIVEPDLT